MNNSYKRAVGWLMLVCFVLSNSSISLASKAWAYSNLRAVSTGNSATYSKLLVDFTSRVNPEDGGLAADAIVNPEGIYVIKTVGKGLADYLQVLPQRIAVNNGTAHGNNYDDEGNLIETKMNLKMTKAIVDAISPFSKSALAKIGINIVQHGVTGTPVGNLPALRNVGIRAAHVGTNWQNIVWETLNKEAKTNPEVAKLVNDMVDELVEKSGDKYGVASRKNADPKKMEKLIGKELKNLFGKYYSRLGGLSVDVKEKINAATEADAIKHMNGFGSDGTGTMVRNHLASLGITVADYASLPGYQVFEALKGTDKTIMCTNIRTPLSIEGIVRAAMKTDSVVIFQQAMSELGYTWPNGYDAENSAKLAQNIKDVCQRLGFKNFMIKGDHITVNIDGKDLLKKYIADHEAQKQVAEIFENILKEKDITKRDAMFTAALNAKYENENIPNVLKSVNKALNLVKAEVKNDFTVFALDASFLPVSSNVRVTAFLAGFIPKTAGLEAEVGEIGGDKNSTVADVLEFLTGIRYEEKIIKDEKGADYAQLVEKNRALMGKNVVKFTDVGKDDGSFVGGKGANLGELYRYVGKVKVPNGVAVTTTAFKKHIDEGLVDVKGKKIKLREFINQRLKQLEATEGGYDNSEALAYAAEDIRNAIVASEMPEDVRKDIIDGYNSLGGGAVAVRSSATAEDLPDASFAGQQDTYLNMVGEVAVVNAVRDNWASLFTDRAIFYRHENNIDHGTTMLSAVIQKMVFSKVAGTAFTVDVGTGFPVYKIDGSYGLGEAVVSGAANPDTWILDKQFRILRRDFGTKLIKIVPTDKQNAKKDEGIAKVDTLTEERNQFALTDEQVKMVAQACEAIQQHYGMYMDIEWAFDENGVLHILQARPETVWNKWEKTDPNTVKIDNTVVPEEVSAKAKTILSGVTGARAASGKVVIVDSSKEGPALARELARVKKGDIMVTTMTTPDMVPAMKRAAGIITDEGGPTCHAAIIARELKVPAVVGTSKATSTLKEGQVVTLEANNGKVYEGALKIVKLDDNTYIPDLPVINTKVGVIVANPFLAMSVSGFSKFASHYGVSLLRKEFTDTMEILVHPLAGLSYDKYKAGAWKDEAEKKYIEEKVMNDKELVATIESTINGYSSYREFYKSKLALAIALIANAQTDGQRVKFRTTDFKTNEYRDQIGGPAFEKHENNPMMGNRGIYRMLSGEYRDAFELELQSIAEARKLQPNIDVMFPVVRTVEEMEEAAALMEKYGLFDGENKAQLGIMVEVSGNVILAEELFSKLSELAKKYGTKAFMSIGSNDLTQFTLALGRDNEKMKPIFNETDPAVKKAIEVVIKTAKKFGITTGLCGQRPSNDPEFAGFLVEVGIDSVGVVPEVYKKVVNVIAGVEKSLQEKGGFNPEVEGFAMPSTLKMATPNVLTTSEVDAASIIKDIGIHPLTLLKYEKGEITDAALKEEIAKMLGGKSAKQYVADKVYEALMAKAKNGNVVYSTDDSQKTAYEVLKDGQQYESFDENPQIGFNGLARVVDTEYAEFFSWQLAGLKKAVEEGNGKISMKLDLVRTLNEVNKVFAMIKDAGLVPGQKGFNVGMEINIMANVLLLDEYVKSGVSFFTENKARYLSYIFAEDFNSPYVQIAAERKEKAWSNSQKVWTNAAVRNNIPMAVVADGGAETLVQARPETVRSISDETLNLANRLKTNPTLLGAFTYAESKISKAQKVNLFEEFINASSSFVNQATSKESPKAIILAPEFFKLGAVTDSLKLLKKFSGNLKIGVYGDLAAGVQILLEKDLGSNVVIGKTEQEVREKLAAIGVESKDIRLARTSKDVVADNSVAEVVADDVAPLALAKVIQDLFGGRTTKEALSSYHEKLAKENVITKETYDATKTAMLTKLSEVNGKLDLSDPSQKLEVSKTVADQVAIDRVVVSAFMDKV